MASKLWKRTKKQTVCERRGHHLYATHFTFVHAEVMTPNGLTHRTGQAAPGLCIDCDHPRR